LVDHGRVRRTKAEPEIAWLVAREKGHGRAVGFGDAADWEASVWLLHAMYENDELLSDTSHDEARRAGLAADLVEPIMVNGVNLDELTTTTGAGLGRSDWPGPGWARLKWADLAARIKTDPFDVAPSHRSFVFPTGSWPVNIRPPAAGSLDREQFSRLCHHLTELYGGDLAVFAFYGLLAMRDWSELLFTASLRELGSLYDDPAVSGSPSNIWPIDRAWFVYTNHDLSGTRVSGSRNLIDVLRADETIDTVNLDW
jgi:hypothetical protein